MNKLKNPTVISTIVLVLFGLWLIVSFVNRNTNQTKSITAVGSTALQPMVEAAGEEFSKEHSGITINVQGGGTGTGLSQVAQGAVELGNSDMFAEEKQGIDANKLVDHKVAVVGIAPIINKDVKVKSVTLKQLADIFTGKIKNWKELGGQDLPIVVLNRAAGSGTRFTFEKLVLHGKNSVEAQEQDSSGMVRSIVATTPGAISYSAFGYINDTVNTLEINDVKASDKNVQKGAWPIWSYEHVYTNGKATGEVKQFLDYLVSNKVQNTIVKKLGYIPVAQMEVERLADGSVIKK